jgi:phosphopantothenate---cysteine ligase (CTP)
MNVLVTAGNTQTPIDKVRCITNIFTGRTGAQVALAGHRRGHRVTLLTSHPEAVRDLAPGFAPAIGTWAVKAYRTFDDLRDLMERELTGGGHDVLIHAAAVSDYELAGVFVPTTGSGFDSTTGRWSGDPMLSDAAARKVKSHHPELWMRLVPTPKLADRVRQPWGFRGTFVKFKLEVGASDDELRAISLKSLVQSSADLIVANTLEEKSDAAFLGDVASGWERVDRPALADRLWDRLESN